MYMRHCIDVDTANNYGFTALMKAALNGKSNCARLLLIGGKIFVIFSVNQSQNIRTCVTCKQATLELNVYDSIQYTRFDVSVAK